MARAYAALILIGFVWGSNFIFIKMATAVLPPMQVVFLRVLVGFLPLALVALWTGAIRRDQLRHLPHFAVMSVLATLEEIEATVNPIEAITPLSGYYFANEMFEEAEQLWARGKQIAERWEADAETLAYYDRMIA